MSDDVAIKVDKVSKTFILPHEKNTSIKSAFVNFYKKKKGYEKQQVLNDISFEIKKGEFFGIVGRNGSGKSTLLKLLAGIYTPDSGGIQINGKLTPFIELGVGFNPELSGRENVFLNGALLGFSRKEMEAMYDEIVEFAELERFMDQKLKNYSSGMQVRLAFSIAIRANTDILVLDEVLAVGDEAFQKKCFEYFELLKREKKTIILVTHDMTVTEKFCNRAVLINDGELVLDSTPVKIASAYREILADRQESKLLTQNKKKARVEKKSAYIQSVKVTDENGKEKAIVKPHEKIKVYCDIKSDIDIEKAVVTMRCDQPSGTKILFAVSSKRKKLPIALRAGKTTTVCWEIDNPLNDGTYILGASIFSNDLKHSYDEALNMYEFQVQGSKWAHSIIWPNDTLTVEKDAK